MNKIPDYVIVGAGPTGLTIASILAKNNKKVLIIDKEKAVGGCHRVRRVDGYFTEHGPRVYSDSFINTRNVLKYQGIGSDLFTAYNPNMEFMKIISDFTFKELFWFIVRYLQFLINKSYSKNNSCLDFMKSHGFTNQSIRFIDRLCRLTDGAGADKYTMFELFNLVNNSFSTFHQPKLPNDIGFIDEWRKALLATNNVSFMLQTECNKLFSDGSDKISGISVTNKKDGMFDIQSDRFILAIPPTSLSKILNKSSNKLIRNSFGDLQELDYWAKMTEYESYIPVSFHWDTRIVLPMKWGFPVSDWGQISIVLSDYMRFNNPGSQTVISTCLSIVDQKSKNTGKTVNESTKEEIIREALAQLRIIYPNLPEPTKSILSEGVVKEAGKWTTKDKAYMRTKNIMNYDGETFISGPSKIFNNLYSVGTHNENGNLHMTTMESAVTNAIVFCNSLMPGTKDQIKIEKTITLESIIKMIVGFIIVFVIIIIVYKKLIKY